MMKEEIRVATAKDIPRLVFIWQESFGDSEEYVTYFYRENFERIKVLAYCIDEQPVSMVHLLDATFVSGSNTRRAKYMYAGATLKAYRNNGYLGKLLEFAKSRASAHGDVLFFKPVSPSLVPFFSKHGFEIDTYFCVATLTPAETLPLAYSEIDYTEYNRMRNAAFCDIPFVRWDDAHLRWCVTENEYFCGKTLKIEYGGKAYFLMAYPEDNTLVVNETNLSLSQLKALSGALCKLFKTECIKAYLPESCDEGEKVISSFVYNTPLYHTYVNQILI